MMDAAVRNTYFNVQADKTEALKPSSPIRVVPNNPIGAIDREPEDEKDNKGNDDDDDEEEIKIVQPKSLGLVKCESRRSISRTRERSGSNLRRNFGKSRAMNGSLRGGRSFLDLSGGGGDKGSDDGNKSALDISGHSTCGSPKREERKALGNDNDEGELDEELEYGYGEGTPEKAAAVTAIRRPSAMGGAYNRRGSLTGIYQQRRATMGNNNRRPSIGNNKESEKPEGSVRGLRSVEKPARVERHNSSGSNKSERSERRSSEKSERTERRSSEKAERSERRSSEKSERSERRSSEKSERSERRSHDKSSHDKSSHDKSSHDKSSHDRSKHHRRSSSKHKVSSHSDNETEEGKSRRKSGGDSKHKRQIDVDNEVDNCDSPTRKEKSIDKEKDSKGKTLRRKSLGEGSRHGRTSKSEDEAGNQSEYLSSPTKSRKCKMSDDNSENSKSKDDAKDHCTLYILLNLDPQKMEDKIDDEKLIALIEKNPAVCAKKCRFKATGADAIYPLHMICCLGGSEETIKKCYNAFPDAICYATKHRKMTCLHFACMYTRASLKGIVFLIKKEPGLIKASNKEKRTALHLACMCSSSFPGHNPEVVMILTELAKKVASKEDKYGNTPLHMACSVDSPSHEVIEDLVAVNQDSVAVQCTEFGATPLHLLCAHPDVAVETSKVVKSARMLAYPSALILENKEGDLPISVAIKHKACYKLLKTLVKMCPETLEKKNKKGDRPYDLAVSNKLDEAIISLLHPEEDSDICSDTEGSSRSSDPEDEHARLEEDDHARLESV